MLEELHFGYFLYSVVVLSGTMVGNLALPRWGRIGDVRGNMSVLRLTMAGASVLPFLWAWFPQAWWLLAAHLVGGFLWGGLNLSAVNFVYDASSPDERARYLAYFNVINGCSVSLGALTGGWLLSAMPPIGGGTVFVTLFIVSASCRCLATVLFGALVREVRPVHQVGLREVMHDLVGQRVIQVMGYFSVNPEQERKD